MLKWQQQIKTKIKLSQIVALSEIGEGARRAGVAKHNKGAPEKSDRLFGERRSSGVNESLRKQFFECAGARDTELVTTRRVWR